MIRRAPGRDDLAAILLGVCVVLASAYFIYSATKGPNGIYEMGRIEAREETLSRQLATLVARREEAENRVRRLSDDYLDLDLLDEQARRVLGRARADEIIIR